MNRRRQMNWMTFSLRDACARRSIFTFQNHMRLECDSQTSRRHHRDCMRVSSSPFLISHQRTQRQKKEANLTTEGKRMATKTPYNCTYLNGWIAFPKSFVVVVAMSSLSFALTRWTRRTMHKTVGLMHCESHLCSLVYYISSCSF